MQFHIVIYGAFESLELELFNALSPILTTIKKHFLENFEIENFFQKNDILPKKRHFLHVIFPNR